MFSRSKGPILLLGVVLLLSAVGGAGIAWSYGEALREKSRAEKGESAALAEKKQADEQRQFAEGEKTRAEKQLLRAEWLLYATASTEAQVGGSAFDFVANIQ